MNTLKRVNIIKTCVIFLMVGIIFISCSNSDKNGDGDMGSLSFKANITEKNENNLLVETIKHNNFDKASVSITKDTKIVDNQNKKIDFKDLNGSDVVEITILPEIRESYPVQVTATKIKLIEQKSQAQKSKYQKITPTQAKEKIDKGNVTIVDVRNESEYAEGHIKNSILIPDFQLSSLASEKLPDKQAEILVYCRSGRRSKIAAETLINLGYTKVFDFGGIIDWPYETTK